MLKRLAAAALLLALACLAGCGAKSSGEVTTLSFKNAVDISEITALDGKQVRIIGYMATLSPVNGKYMYLMNLPYQSCPFCVPNTTQLANTMAMYAPDGKKFDYTDQAIAVTGTIKVGDYTDEYGYVYNYRVVNASYEVVDLSQVSEEYSLWMSIAGDGIVADINAMLNYVNFTCQWTEYTSTMDGEDGSTITYFLYPGDADNYLKDDGPYGYASYAADGYFEGLIKRVNAISDTGLEELVSIIEDAQQLQKQARDDLDNGRYQYDKDADKYVLDNSADLADRFSQIYARFSGWLGKWEI